MYCCVAVVSIPIYSATQQKLQLDYKYESLPKFYHHKLKKCLKELVVIGIHSMAVVFMFLCPLVHIEGMHIDKYI